MNYYFWSDPGDLRGKFPVPGIPLSPGTKNVRGIPTPTENKIIENWTKLKIGQKLVKIGQCMNII